MKSYKKFVGSFLLFLCCPSHEIIRERRKTGMQMPNEITGLKDEGTWALDYIPPFHDAEVVVPPFTDLHFDQV